jgi:hypothetical protein
MTDWRRDTVVVRLTTKVHDLVAAAARRSADAVATIGQHLAKIRERLPHGQWLAWIADNAPFSHSTAANYIELAQWSLRAPAEFARLRHLGPGKLYVLAAVPPQRVRALKPGKLLAIPGSLRRKTIEHMTKLELFSLVGNLALPPAPVVPIEKVVQGMRFKMAALGVAADTMIGRAKEVDRTVVREIQEELVAVLGRIDAAFGE